MRNFLLSLVLVFSAVSAWARVESPFYEELEVNGKVGLLYNGELCRYPIYDDIAMAGPLCTAWDRSAPIKEIRRQMHEISVGDLHNSVTYGGYAIGDKWGLMTQSRHITEPIYLKVTPYRFLRHFKKTGDQMIALALIRTPEGNGVIDLNGDTVIAPIYYDIEDIISLDEFECNQKDNNNIFFVLIDSNNIRKVLDVNGNVVLDGGEALYGEDLIKQLRKIEKKNNKDKAYAGLTDLRVQRIVDAYKKWVTGPREGGAYSMAECTPMGASVFRQGTAYGVLSAQGDTIVPPIFDEISQFDDAGVALAKVNDIKGYVNELGYISYPVEYLSFPSVVQLQMVDRFNAALDVYPTSTYTWLFAADYYMNSNFAEIEQGYQPYAAAAEYYKMAFAMAQERDEMDFISNQNYNDYQRALDYASGKAVPIEERVETDGWAMAADIFNSIVGLTKQIQQVTHPNQSFTAFDDEVSETPFTDGAGNPRASRPLKSDRHGSVSETSAMNADNRTYCNYETQLIKMRNGDNYDDSRRRNIQSKMKRIRTKWEKRGYNFYHAEIEDWGGN